MIKKIVGVASISIALIAGLHGTASASNRSGPYTDRDGHSGKSFCQGDRVGQYANTSECYEDPAGSGQWYFNIGPRQPGR